MCPAGRRFSAAAFVLALLVSVVAEAAAPAPAGRPKAPFKVIYSNDTTNIVSCVSPYHAKRSGFNDDLLRASIDEARAADAQFLQPGMGWIPWWKSKIYPAAEHYRYYQEKYHVQPNDFGRYMLDGGDLVQTFIDHCRRRHLAAFISLRLNDAHGLEDAGKGTRMACHTVSRFYEEHFRQYRLGTDQSKWPDRALNWAIPAVREHKLAFIRELCEGYDLDGFELDFLRFAAYFRPAETTSPQRREIMTGFVREVRGLLDRTAAPGRRRWLCVRVPAFLASHDQLGIDLPALVAAGVDMVNLSSSYFTVQQTDLPAIRRLVPAAAVYLEMTHTTMTGPRMAAGYDSFPFFRTTPQQFSTTAHLAYDQGADGLSLFNFVYYREHGAAGRGPFNEPPFEVLGRLPDRDWLARQPQWYLVTTAPGKALQALPPLSKPLKPGQGFALQLHLAPTAFQSREGLVRIMTKEPAAPAQEKPGSHQDPQTRAWLVELNGQPLEPTALVAKPLPHPYEVDLGTPEQYACFRCPRTVARHGPNTLSITLRNGPPRTVQYVDLVLP